MPDSLTLPIIGHLRPRSADEITSSTWSVGGETLDRDYAIYDNYKQYLGPLGAKHLRLQAGWAKCERQVGTYDFTWLDAVVDDARSQGVQPWLETAYGNLLYPGGGGIGLGDGLPRSPVALAGWDHWVQALVGHFRERISTWEIWNEPDLGQLHQGLGDVIAGDAYADFFVRTAQIIRAAQPTARIIGLALAGKLSFAETFLRQLRELGKLALLDVVTVHGYPTVPDDLSSVTSMQGLLKTYAPGVTVWQGETGAPSQGGGFGALQQLAWTDLTQTKWNLRRMLAHRAHDVPYNIFTLADLNYTGRMNTKGLVGANPDKTIIGPKPVYRATQNTLAVFDDHLVRQADFPVTSNANSPLALTTYQHRITGHRLMAVWLKGAPPTASNSATPVSFKVPPGTFANPVLVDLRTGHIHAVAGDLEELPIYDSPMLIAELAMLPRRLV
jgi:hypothetical protein